MKLWKLGLSGLVSLACLFVSPESKAATITFEGTEFSGLLGSVSGDLYQSEGVVFNNDSLGYLAYFQNGFAGIVGSDNYSIAFGPASSTDYGMLRADFFVPETLASATVTSVSMWAGDASIESETITLTAFSRSGEELDSDSFTTGWQPGHAPSAAELSVSAENIAYVEIRGSHVVSMDNFTFDTPVKTPESGSLLALGAVGIAGLFTLGRMKKPDLS